MNSPTRAEHASLGERLRSVVRQQRRLDSAGVVAATVLFVALNILAARFFWRWDGTSAKLFTLSEPTVATLQRVNEPLDVVVLLSRNDPLIHSVSALLEEYRATSGYVRSRFVDPDRNPAEFVAVQHQYGLLEGRTEEGRRASEASIVLALGSKHWFITTDDIVAYDEQAALAQPRLEQVLTEGVARLVGQERQVACFLRGAQELSSESGGPQGLSEFRRYLERNNVEVRVVEFGLARPEGSLRGCDLAIAIGPTRPYASPASDELGRWVKRGGRLLLGLGPVTDDDGRIVGPGLDPVLSPLGVKAGNNAVFEADPSLRMPVGMGGEVFLASPRAHAITAGMLRGEMVTHHVLLQLAQSFDIAPEGIAKPILTTSERAQVLRSFRGLIQDKEPFNDGGVGQLTMAVAGEYLAEERADDGRERPGRLVVVGTPSVFWSSTWQEPALLGTRRFVESAVSWLNAERPLVSVPEKPVQAAGLALTDEGMDEVRQYVLVYLPATMAAIGALLIWGRRREAKGKVDS